MESLRLLWMIIRRLKLKKFLIGFVIWYCIACTLLWKLDPSLETFPDALWFGFMLITTIGFGDYTVTTIPARIAAAALGLYGDLTILFFTGIITSWIYEKYQASKGKSITQFMDKLERLHELDDAELEKLSSQVKQTKGQGSD